MRGLSDFKILPLTEEKSGLSRFFINACKYGLKLIFRTV